jgi:hypothetical protein
MVLTTCNHHLEIFTGHNQRICTSPMQAVEQSCHIQFRVN